MTPRKRARPCTAQERPRGRPWTATLRRHESEPMTANQATPVEGNDGDGIEEEPREHSGAAETFSSLVKERIETARGGQWGEVSDRELADVLRHQADRLDANSGEPPER